jgi:hypothetical protein
MRVSHRHVLPGFNIAPIALLVQVFRLVCPHDVLPWNVCQGRIGLIVVLTRDSLVRTLYNMSYLMCEQSPSVLGLRLISPTFDEDVRPNGEGLRPKLPAESAGALARVNSYITQVDTDPRFEIASHTRVEGTAASGRRGGIVRRVRADRSRAGINGRIRELLRFDLERIVRLTDSCVRHAELLGGRPI